MRTDTVEQLFVRRTSGRVEIRMVLESPAGERQRETLLAPTASLLEGVTYAATHLGRRGIRASRRLRLRVDRAGVLTDDAALKDAFLAALERERRGEPWA